jgi:hypothetical protein
MRPRTSRHTHLKADNFRFGDAVEKVIATKAGGHAFGLLVDPEQLFGFPG